MFEKMVLTLFVAWVLIALWASAYGLKRKRVFILCSRCGASEEKDGTHLWISDNPGKHDKYLCTKCQEGGDDAADKTRSSNRSNGT